MNKVGAAVLQKTFHKDTLHNRRQVWALILVFLQITHISVAATAAAAAAAEGSREAASLYQCPLHLAKVEKKQTTVKEGERRFDRCPPGMEIWKGLHQTLMLQLTSLQHQPVVCSAAASAGILVALDQLSSSHQTSLPTHSYGTVF
jgi:hypothetical protein